VLLSTSDVDGLPEFARAAWSTSFLPTLYDSLACASKPWDLPGDGSDMVKFIQEILDSVYPGTGYQVKLNDRIFSMARDRINEKRTYFGRQSIKIVTAFFATEPYANKPKVIAKYAKWATRKDGPGVWRVPTPIDCVVPSESPDYIAPKDLFESQFVIELLAPFLKWCKGSHVKPNGAVAMAATGIERAFSMFEKTGKHTDVGQFSFERVGTVVNDYVTNSQKFS
ncbi:hypothetical protein PILCRDRAFT_49899, partial [Piloderma croceum F 1598]